MSVIDGRGMLVDDPDDPDELELRRHCVRCGAFLSKEPEQHMRMIPTDFDYTYDAQGETTGIVIRQEEPEIEAVWTCKRCGHEHDADEMYI